MVSDINRNFELIDREHLKGILKENNYDNINNVLTQLVENDRKIKKLLNSNKGEAKIKRINKRKDE